MGHRPPVLAEQLLQFRVGRLGVLVDERRDRHLHRLDAAAVVELAEQVEVRRRRQLGQAIVVEQFEHHLAADRVPQQFVQVRLTDLQLLAGGGDVATGDVVRRRRLQVVVDLLVRHDHAQLVGLRIEGPADGDILHGAGVALQVEDERRERLLGARLPAGLAVRPHQKPVGLLHAPQLVLHLGVGHRHPGDGQFSRRLRPPGDQHPAEQTEHGEPAGVQLLLGVAEADHPADRPQDQRAGQNPQRGRHVGRVLDRAEDDEREHRQRDEHDDPDRAAAEDFEGGGHPCRSAFERGEPDRQRAGRRGIVSGRIGNGSPPQRQPLTRCPTTHHRPHAPTAPAIDGCELPA